ncbi:hypothetical protein ABTW57_06160 [Serratia sp. SM59]|uniref:hypothetical protein n=1 Tax=Serratia TaxID=613 RepID=UPI0027681D0F|nr:hypothetical protein [Serratia marcescens]MDP8745345.1 hypothetical protein [Serratia marcescens]
MKRFTPDCSMHMSHEMAFMRETPDGAYMEYQDHLPVKTQRDNLAIRVTELEMKLLMKPMFSAEELNLFRQWFNSMEDTNPAYIQPSDQSLYRKVLALLAWPSKEVNHV